MKKITALALTQLIAMDGALHSLEVGGPSAEALSGAMALSQSITMATKSHLVSMSHNAAGLAFLEGAQISWGLTPVYVGTSRRDPDGTKEKVTMASFQIPNFYLGSPLKTERFYFGLGVTALSGLGTDWSPTGSSRYFATNSAAAQTRINPTAAFKPAPNLAVGAGINYTRGKAELKKQTNITALNFALGGDIAADPDGTAVFSGAGDDWGYNFGLLWRPDQRQTWGAYYRSRFKTKFEGSFTFTGLKDESNAFFGGSSYVTDGRFRLPYPDSFAVGYSFQLNPKLELSAETQWANWSILKELKIDYTQETNPGRLTVLNADNPSPKNWKDTYAFGVSAEYKSDKRLVLRGGAQFTPSPVPDSTFDPGLGYYDFILFGLGCSYALRPNKTIELGYAIVFDQPRSIDNNAGAPLTSADGNYKALRHALGLNMTLRL